MSNLFRKPWLWLTLLAVCLLGFGSRFWNSAAPPRMAPDEQSALRILEQVSSVGYCQSSQGAVVELSISEVSLSTEHASQLAAFSQLHTFHLENSRISEATLSSLRAFPKLEVLYVDGTAIGDEGLKRLSPLCAKLRHLSLAGCNVSDAGLSSIVSLKGLKILDLSKTQVTDAGLQFLKGLPQLEVLFVRDLPLTGAGLVSIGQHTSLVKLDMSRTQLTSEHVAGLANFPQLEQLFLSGCPIDDQMIAVLLEQLARTNSSLRALTISQTPLTDAAIEPLKILTSLPQLSLVQMRQTGISIDAFHRLADIATEINFSVDYPVD